MLLAKIETWDGIWNILVTKQHKTSVDINTTPTFGQSTIQDLAQCNPHGWLHKYTYLKLLGDPECSRPGIKWNCSYHTSVNTWWWSQAVDNTGGGHSIGGGQFPGGGHSIGAV